MDIQRPMFWHQGLFLQPHHFQQADLYFQSLQMPFRKFLSPFFWGVAGCEISPGALENKSFEVTGGEFIFPDGTYAVYPGNALLAGRSFADAWTEGDKPLTVYIGLKKLDKTSPNVTEQKGLNRIAEVSTRYVTSDESEQVEDLYETGPPGEVRKLHLMLKIFWESEKEMAGDYLLVPIARLERHGETIQLAPNFSPPAIALQGSEILIQTVRDIRDQIASRSRQLDEYKKQRGVHTSDFGTRDMIFMLASRTLCRYVPLLFHLTEPHAVHPWQVFGLLRQLIGELSSFSDSVNAVGELNDGTDLLGRYDHQNPSECFLAAQSLISRLLDEITAGPDYIIQLLYDGTYYAADLAPAQFAEGSRYYLVVGTEEPQNDVIEALQGIAKLGSRESLPLLIARALPGISLKYLSAPPRELPHRPESLYFQIDHHNDLWASVIKGGNLALYWDNSPEDLTVEMMIIERN